MEIRLFGRTLVVNSCKTVPLSAPKLRQLLALLALRTGELVSTESIISELWGETPPRSATTTTQTYIYQLRKLLAEHAEGDDPKVLLETHEPGYTLLLPRSSIDVYRFYALVAELRSARRESLTEAADLACSALRLVENPPLADVAVGPVLRAHVTRLAEEILNVLQYRIVLDMRLGRHQDLVGELRSLVTLHPLSEWFHYYLILALHRSGRRDEALRAIHDVRALMRDELGIVPMQAIAQLHQDVLQGTPAAMHGSDRSGDFTIDIDPIVSVRR